MAENGSTERKAFFEALKILAGVSVIAGPVIYWSVQVSGELGGLQEHAVANTEKILELQKKEVEQDNATKDLDRKVRVLELWVYPHHQVPPN